MTVVSDQLVRFRDVASRELGLHLAEARDDVLAAVLVRRASARSVSVAAYLDAVEGAPRRSDEIRALAAELTVGETYFFRHIEQLRALADVAVPDRARIRGHASSLRILVAGCASGEEPYTVAMLLLERGIELAPGAIRAVDVNAKALERARRGVYGPWALRETPAESRQRFFRASGADLHVSNAVRSSVRFDERNLADPTEEVGSEGSYDVIVCRNVLMYFSPDRAREVVRRFVRLLAPRGYLFLGHAETLRGVSSDFDLLHANGAFFYQLASSGRAARKYDAVGEHMPQLSSAPAPLDLDWVDSIRTAAEKVQRLTDSSQAVPPRAEGARFDVGPAMELLRAERFADALSALPNERSDRPGDPEVLLLRAALLTQRGELAAAERACRDLLSIDGLHAGAHYLLSICREAAGARDVADDEARMAAYLDPTFAMPHVQLGLSARRLGDHDTARRELRAAIDLLHDEDPTRVLLFGGGFTREGLLALCRSTLEASGRVR